MFFKHILLVLSPITLILGAFSAPAAIGSNPALSGRSFVTPTEDAAVQNASHVPSERNSRIDRRATEADYNHEKVIYLYYATDEATAKKLVEGQILYHLRDQSPGYLSLEHALPFAPDRALTLAATPGDAFRAITRAIKYFSLSSFSPTNIVKYKLHKSKFPKSKFQEYDLKAKHFSIDEVENFKTFINENKASTVSDVTFSSGFGSGRYDLVSGPWEWAGLPDGDSNPIIPIYAAFTKKLFDSKAFTVQEQWSIKEFGLNKAERW